MKLASIILLFGIFAVTPAAVYADSGEMSKKEAASFLRDLVKEKIEEGASKVAPETMKAIDNVKKTLDRAKLASSLCWELIQLGLANDERKFATEFVKVFSKYIPKTATVGADVVNPTLENVFGWRRVPTEADYRTALYELGKNTYQAITRMSGTDKQKAQEAGYNIQNLGTLMIGIGGSTGRQYKKMINTYK